MSRARNVRRTGVVAASVVALGVLFAPVASAQSAGLHAPDKAGDARTDDATLKLNSGFIIRNQPALDMLDVSVRLDSPDLISFTTLVATAPTPAQLAANSYFIEVGTSAIPPDGAGGGGFYGLQLDSTVNGLIAKDGVGVLGIRRCGAVL